jgi:serine/threonine-protein kinase HipA
MIDELCVLLDDRLAGRVTRKQGALRFVYEDEYRRRRAPTPLSVSMPVETAEHQDQTVAPWLAGLLPDNESVIARWARTFQVGNSPFALLGTPVGEDCAGAVRFVTEDRLEAALSRDGTVQWLTDAEVAKRLRDLKRDETAWLGSDFTGRFSLAGAQAKTALLYQDGQWGVPSGAAATTHILKPAITGFDDHDLNEHLCLTAARRAGLVAANTWIATFEDQSAIVAERYDRVISPQGWIRRIHQEDTCQALGVPPGRKYENEGGPTPTAIASLLRRMLPGSDADVAVLRFFDALTLNWLICGTDAHSKNYSLLLAGRQVRLAPLYDVASALPYPDMPLQKLRLAMKFGGSYLVTSRSPDMWPRVSKELGLSVDVVLEHAQALMDRLPDAFADAARDPSIAAIQSTMPASLVDAVADRVQKSKATLGHAEPPTMIPTEHAAEA